MFLYADSEDSVRLGRYTQADPSLRWVQRSFCWFCHEVALLKIYTVLQNRVDNVMIRSNQ